MRYPELIPKRFCKVPITVTIYGEGLTEDGAPVEIFSESLLCNFQQGNRDVLTDEQKIPQAINATALFNGDFCPGIDSISGGAAVVFGVERKIASGQKWRNPDGSVNYIRLDLV
jgi:hypothetical protein